MKLKDVQEMRKTIDRTEILSSFVTEALTAYQKNNDALPEKIVIYRDDLGGPSMTELVKKLEVKVISDLLENTTPGYNPKIVYCLIDRHTQHRIFYKENDNVLNPG